MNRPVRTMLAVASAGLAAAGCGSSSHGTSAPASGGPVAATAPTAPPSSSPAAPDVRQELLAVSDLPAGWAVDNTPDTSSQRGCAGIRTELEQGQTAQAEARFDHGGGTPTLDQIVAAYPSVAAASSVFTALKSQLDACKSTTVQAKGASLTLTLGQLSIGAYGDATDAWQYSGTYQGISLAEDEVLVLKGDQICGVAYGDIGSPAVSAIQAILGRAVSKLTS